MITMNIWIWLILLATSFASGAVNVWLAIQFRRMRKREAARQYITIRANEYSKAHLESLIDLALQRGVRYRKGWTPPALGGYQANRDG